MADDDLEARVNDLLAGCSTMTLASSGPEGLWAADVFFAARGTAELFFISSLNSRHARNVLAASGAAATVHAETGNDWRAIRGLQMEGAVGLVGDEATENAQAVYFAKFPFAAQLLQPDSDVAAKTAGTRFFVLRVTRLYLVDNRLGFGNRREIRVERMP